jgi:hypothetical protein
MVRNVYKITSTIYNHPLPSFKRKKNSTPDEGNPHQKERKFYSLRRRRLTKLFHAHFFFLGENFDAKIDNAPYPSYLPNGMLEGYESDFSWSCPLFDHNGMQ